jgi:hypothetical protein
MMTGAWVSAALLVPLLLALTLDALRLCLCRQLEGNASVIGFHVARITGNSALHQ